MFFWNSLTFFDDPMDVGNLISGSSAFSKSSLNIWKFSVLLKLRLENFEHYFASMWDEYNCVVVSAFFGIAFLWDWNENWPFPVLWPRLSFPNLLAYWVPYCLFLVMFLLIYSDLEEEWGSNNFLLRNTNFSNQVFFWPDLKKLCTVNLDSDCF